MKTISRYIMTLALLITAVTGAWAQEEVLLTTITPTGDESYNETTPGVVTVTPSNMGWYSENFGWCWYESGSLTVEAKEGYTITRCVFKQNDKTPATITSSPFAITFNEDGKCEQNTDMDGFTSIEVYGSAASSAAEAPITVKWNASTKTGTFSMPGSDVVLTPLYAPAAKWAVVESVEQLPEAAEGVIAGTDASLIAEGTGIVAFAGTSTEDTQGTLMYAIGTSDTQAPAPAAFSATVPTAKNVADDGATLYVWYYIQGADAPEGVAATLDNTFDDTEPACLTVTVLTNKFDITLNAANANTIEADKATVTVDGAAATVTDGKLKAVKMGSEVKMTAKQGYKFRKVEVKKKAATTSSLLSAATAEDIGKVVCAAGHLHEAKTAVPDGCTAVGILGKVTETGHGLILSLQNATYQEWVTVNGWASETSYAGTTLKVLPDDAARGTNLTSYTKLGDTAVSNWAVAQKDDYVAIFVNLGSEVGDSDGITCSESMDVYITPAGGTSIYAASGLDYISATSKNDEKCWGFNYSYWKGVAKSGSYNAKNVRPVLGF